MKTYFDKKSFMAMLKSHSGLLEDLAKKRAELVEASKEDKRAHALLGYFEAELGGFYAGLWPRLGMLEESGSTDVLEESNKLMQAVYDEAMRSLEEADAEGRPGPAMLEYGRELAEAIDKVVARLAMLEDDKPKVNRDAMLDIFEGHAKIVRGLGSLFSPFGGALELAPLSEVDKSEE